DDREMLAEAVADQLLQRWGVVFRDLVVHEGMPLPWRDLQRALRRFEDRGLVRGGRFVAGFSGEQYALPAAVEGLADIRRRPRSGERVTVNACDPLTLTGVIIRGPRTPGDRGLDVDAPTRMGHDRAGARPGADRRRHHVIVEPQRRPLAPFEDWIVAAGPQRPPGDADGG